MTLSTSPPFLGKFWALAAEHIWLRNCSHGWRKLEDPPFTGKQNWALTAEHLWLHNYSHGWRELEDPLYAD